MSRHPTSPVATGLDRLLADPASLAQRRYGLLAHQASITGDGSPAHLALAASGNPPQRLLGPEHGYYAVEQDMVAAADGIDPFSGLAIRSLYGESEHSLRPEAAAFEGLDLLVIDLQDVGARYYTYAATAVWAAEVALEAGLEVWILDRPNPIGGTVVEGNLRQPGFESFVGVFELPVRHGLTLGELVRWACSDHPRLLVWAMEGWQRRMVWPDTGCPFVAPSPNMPSFNAAALYPGLCLIEGTSVSEGRGTTRPFQLVGAPWVDGKRLAERAGNQPGVRALPTLFRPQFQKHAGEVCVGVELLLDDVAALHSYRLGYELICELWEQASEVGIDLWRREAYEFVTDRPAIDLLFGTDRVRRALEAGDEVSLASWLASWEDDVAAFRRTTAPFWLYE